MARNQAHRWELSDSYENELLKKVDHSASRLLFLSEVSRRLSVALTDEDCFRHLMELLVPELADWATITLIGEQGEVWRALAAHANPEKAEVMSAIENKYLPHLEDEVGPGAVMRNMKAEFYPDFEPFLEERLGRIRYPELAAWVRFLGVRSEICVPVQAHGHVIGAILLVNSDSERRYSKDDLKLVEDIARRVATAAYHLLRYESASQALERLQVENAMMTDYFSQIRHDVLSALTSATLLAQMLQRKVSDPMACKNLAQKVILTIERVSQILRKTWAKQPETPTGSRHSA